MNSTVGNVSGIPQMNATTSVSPQSKVQVGVSITRCLTIEAAHALPYHKGKCRRLHGHSYRVEVTIQGLMRPLDADDSESGMIRDFASIDAEIKHIIKANDHTLLNDNYDYPTAERLAVKWLFDLRVFDSRYKSVTVWETDDSSATATAI